MFYFIGIGLGDAKDITVKGLEIVKNADKVFLEYYTSILTCGKEALEEFYGREIILADRDLVEQESEKLFEDASSSNVAFLVVGDPLGATTHTDLILRATEKGIKYQVVHNASIINAVGCCGLHLYRFGEVISICFWTENWRPESYYDKIICNLERGLHTLCLLDIKIKEQTLENMMKRNKIYEPPRFMKVSDACSQLLEIAEKRSSNKESVQLNRDSICIGLARVGCDNQKIVVGKLYEMAEYDMGDPLHSLIIAGELHPVEIEMLQLFSINESVLKNQT